MSTKAFCTTISDDDDKHSESFCKTFHNSQVFKKTEINQSCGDKKYLQYYASGGLANQVNCLVLGYWFAVVTGRVLIVPPKIPRNPARQLECSFLPSPDSTDPFIGNLLNSSELLRIMYAEQKPTREMIDRLRCRYTEEIMNYTMPFFNYTREDLLPFEKVLDLDYILPRIEKINLHDFYINHWRDNMTDWVLSYNRFDTIFIKNQTQLENKTNTKKGRTKTYRDLSKIGRKYDKFDVWTIYDTMQLGRSAVHSSLFDYHMSFFKYKMRYSETVRLAARTAHVKFDCIPYVSVHIRATEPSFDWLLPKTLSSSMDNAVDATTNWLDSIEEMPARIGLFILTDWAPLFEHPLFQETLLLMKRRLGKTKLVLLTEAGNSATGYMDIALELGKSLGIKHGEAHMILAQQIAACGRIGFFGTPRSTFSFLIENIRNSPCAC